MALTFLGHCITLITCLETSLWPALPCLPAGIAALAWFYDAQWLFNGNCEAAKTPYLHKRELAACKQLDAQTLQAQFQKLSLNDWPPCRLSVLGRSCFGNRNSWEPISKIKKGNIHQSQWREKIKFIFITFLFNLLGIWKSEIWLWPLEFFWQQQGPKEETCALKHEFHKAVVSKVVWVVMHQPGKHSYLPL